LAVGCSVSLISSAEDKFYKALTKKTGICLDKLNLDSRILAVAQERVNLASKIAGVADEDRKRHRDNQWFIDHAAEAGLEIDDDLLDNGEQMDKRQQAKRSGMDTAKQQLRTMLSEPMRVQRFGKFLSTNLSATQSTVPEATPLPPQPMTKKRRKRKWDKNLAEKLSLDAVAKPLVAANYDLQVRNLDCRLGRGRFFCDVVVLQGWPSTTWIFLDMKLGLSQNGVLQSDESTVNNLWATRRRHVCPYFVVLHCLKLFAHQTNIYSVAERSLLSMGRVVGCAVKSEPQIGPPSDGTPGGRAAVRFMIRMIWFNEATTKKKAKVFATRVSETSYVDASWLCRSCRIQLVILMRWSIDPRVVVLLEFR
jgi:hypothetical protein